MRPVKGALRHFSRVLLSGLALLICANRLHAGVNRWTPLGPYRPGAGVSALAVDPISPSTVYAGTMRAGIFRSTDRGTTWSSANEGIGDGYVTSLVPDARVSAIYALTVSSGLWKSEDGGARWVRLHVFPIEPILDLALDPLAPSTLYVATGNLGRLHRSDDGGVSWRPVLDGLQGAYVFSVAVDGTNSAVVYTATSNGLFRSGDGGTTWNHVVGPSGSGVFVKTVPGSTAVYAQTSDGLFRSLTGGVSWTRVEVAPSPSYVQRLWIGQGANSSLYALTSGYALLRSTDGGDHWTRADEGIPDAWGIAAIATDPSSPWIVYAGHTGEAHGGVYKSTNGGATWTKLGGSFDPYYVTRIRAHPAAPGRLWAGTANEGVLLSTDAGRTWNSKNAGLERLRVEDLQVAPSTPSVLYAIAEQRLFRSTDGAESWRGINPTPQSLCTAVAIDPLTPSRITAAFFEAAVQPYFYSIQQSNDGGDTWTVVYTHPTRLIGALAIPPSSPTTMYAGLSQTGLLKSTDSGRTWTHLSVPDVSSIVSLALDPRSPGTVYAASAYTGVRGTFPPIPGTIYKTTDGGTTWTRILETFDPPTVAVNPFSPDEAYVATTQGGPVLRSCDGGVTWRQAAPDLFAVPQSFAFAPGSPTTVYAGTTASVFEAQFTRNAEGYCADPTVLTLRNARFSVQVTWRAPAGALQMAQAVPLTSDTGAFWFFTPSNLELVVKVLDGWLVNRRFWVFYGSLTNVEFSLTVTDLFTGASKTYFNAQGRLASVADTDAF